MTLAMQAGGERWRRPGQSGFSLEMPGPRLVWAAWTHRPAENQREKEPPLSQPYGVRAPKGQPSSHLFLLTPSQRSSRKQHKGHRLPRDVSLFQRSVSTLSLQPGRYLREVHYRMRGTPEMSVMQAGRIPHLCHHPEGLGDTLLPPPTLLPSHSEALWLSS